MLDLIATAPMGLEGVVARELKGLGYDDVQTENGRVRFRGNERDIARANLWLRTTDRILIQMGQFEATTFEALFEQTKALPWADWLPADANFPVEGKSHQSQLSSVPACQAIVKKAVVESLKQRYRQSWFEETGARYRIEVQLHKDVATLVLDTTGAGLHKRGYRKLTAQAPLKETLAAALVLLSRWHPDRPLHDPFCGSGTIAIEAALIGRKIAPGSWRNFASEGWPRLPDTLWRELRQEARELAHWSQPLQITGSDIDPKVLSLADYHARKTGLPGVVRFSQARAQEAAVAGDYGFVITNPPYGERLDEQAAHQELVSFCKRLPTWSYYVLTANRNFERLMGQRATRRRKLYNGRIECQYYQYVGPKRPRPEGVPH